MNRFHSTDRSFRCRNRRFALAVEGLETRLALSTAAATLAHALPTVHTARAVHTKSVTETISGRVVNASSNRGLSGVAVQLLDAEGEVVRTTRSGFNGNYRFSVPSQGTYVVRELTPVRWTQVTPTFSSTAPTGTYAPGAGANSWNYVTGNSDPANGPVGPASWATIAPAGTSPFQSPIDLKGPTIDLSSVLSVNYANATPSQIINNGHQIQVQFSPSTGDTVTVAGQSFTLSQFHYHDPSENTINGHAFSMEEHFVNVSASGATTVVAVFLQLGPHNPNLDPILNAATASLTAPNSKTTIATPIDFAGLLPTSTQGYFYQGSLTTPPLSSPVNWFVYATPITLDFAQLSQYEKVAAGSGFLPNTRPIQPLDGRRLNEVDYNVSIAGQSLTNLDFSLQKKPRA